MGSLKRAAFAYMMGAFGVVLLLSLFISNGKIEKRWIRHPIASIQRWWTAPVLLYQQDFFLPPSNITPNFVRSSPGRCGMVKENLTINYVKASWGHSRSSPFGRSMPYRQFRNRTQRVQTGTLHRPGVVLLLPDNVAEDYMLKQSAVQGVPVAKWMASKGFTSAKFFNRMGENSVYNMLPLLTGKTYSPEMRKSWDDIAGLSWVFDHFKDEIISKKFVEQGRSACMGKQRCAVRFAPFVTAFAEDGSWANTFVYGGYYFRKKQIVDYHLSPILERDGIGYKVKGKYCNKRFNGSSPNHVFFWARELVQNHRGGNMFLYFKSCVTHDENKPFQVFMDETMYTLEFLDATGALDNYFVAVMSDHGWKNRPSSQPFAFLRLPKGFQEAYPLATTKFMENANQYLTSHKDLHKVMNLLVHSCSYYVHKSTFKSFDWHCGGTEFDADNARNMKREMISDADQQRRASGLKLTNRERKVITNSFTEGTPFSMFDASYKDYDDCREHSVPFTFCTRGMVGHYNPGQTLQIIKNEFGVPHRTALAARATQKLAKMFDKYIDSRRSAVAKGFSCIKNLNLNVARVVVFKLPRYSHGSPYIAKLTIKASSTHGKRKDKRLSSASWTVVVQAPNIIELADIMRNDRYGPHSKCVKDDKLLPKFCFCLSALEN